MKKKYPIYYERQKLAKKLKQESLLGKKIVFTNGCFDILHRGHVAYLEKARNLGDLLVVGLNSDKSVKKIKGSERPLNKEKDRAFVLVNLKSVDYVCLFDESTPAGLIRKLRPDLLVKGGDYRKEEIAGAKDVESRGGDIVILPFLKGYSTTGLIRKLLEGKFEV